MLNNIALCSEKPVADEDGQEAEEEEEEEEEEDVGADVSLQARGWKRGGEEFCRFFSPDLFLVFWAWNENKTSVWTHIDQILTTSCVIQQQKTGGQKPKRTRLNIHAGHFAHFGFSSVALYKLSDH